LSNDGAPPHQESRRSSNAGAIPLFRSTDLPASYSCRQVEVPAATPLSEAIPHIATLWNTMLKMRKLADCCNDLATYCCFPTAVPQKSYHIIPRFLSSRVCHRYGEAKPPAEQGIDEFVSQSLLIETI
jgi:hypothetical protein